MLSPAWNMDFQKQTVKRGAVIHTPQKRVFFSFSKAPLPFFYPPPITRVKQTALPTGYSLILVLDTQEELGEREDIRSGWK